MYIHFFSHSKLMITIVERWLSNTFSVVVIVSFLILIVGLIVFSFLLFFLLSLCLSLSALKIMLVDWEPEVLLSPSQSSGRSDNNKLLPTCLHYIYSTCVIIFLFFIGLTFDRLADYSKDLGVSLIIFDM